MTSEDAYHRLTDVIRDVLGDDSIIIGPQTSAADIAGWDSVNHIAILVAVEMRFDIKFHTAEMEDLRNAGELVALIERKRNGA